MRCAVDRFNHRRYEKTSQSAAAATARAAAAAAAAGGNGQELGTMNREIIVSCLAFCVFIKPYVKLKTIDARKTFWRKFDKILYHL